MARHRCCEGELEDSDLRIAQSAGRGPRFHPNRFRRLPVHPVWPARIPRPTAVSIRCEQSCGPTEPSFRGSAGNHYGAVSPNELRHSRTRVRSKHRGIPLALLPPPEHSDSGGRPQDTRVRTRCIARETPRPIAAARKAAAGPRFSTHRSARLHARHWANSVPRTPPGSSTHFSQWRSAATSNAAPLT
jgi:hypothetical protein